MGCGKSKHDVVTGNTTTVRKPSEAESVKGKENETTKRQEICRCQKTNDVSSAVSTNRPEITVENNNKKPEEKEAGGNCGEKPAGETNDEQKPEEKETTSMPLETAIVSENIVTEETVNDVEGSVLPVDEQKEKVDTEMVVEDEKSLEDKANFGDVDTEIPPLEFEEPTPDVETPVTADVETPVTAESDVLEILTTENVETATAAENVEIVSTENDEGPVLQDEDKVDLVEVKTAKEVESA